jgi:hypothetical protein
VTAKQRLKSIIKTTAIGVNMSKESEEKALPGYKSLATSQRELNLQNQNMMLQNKIIIDLLTSLNHYHGNPESESGWLEDLYKVTKCEKKATKEHRSTGLKFAVLVTIAALVGESLSKGESSIFITALKFAKGLVL